MIKVPSFRLQQCLGPLLCSLGNGMLKGNFSYIYLITFFGDGNFGKISFMRVIFFFRKCSKYNVDLKNREKNWEKVFCLWYNSIWIGSVKLFLLRREYLPSAVHESNSLKILHSTNIDFFLLNYIQSDL